QERVEQLELCRSDDDVGQQRFELVVMALHRGMGASQLLRCLEPGLRPRHIALLRIEGFARSLDRLVPVDTDAHLHLRDGGGLPGIGLDDGGEGSFDRSLPGDLAGAAMDASAAGETTEAVSQLLGCLDSSAAVSAAASGVWAGGAAVKVPSTGLWRAIPPVRRWMRAPRGRPRRLYRSSWSPSTTSGTSAVSRASATPTTTSGMSSEKTGP